MKRRNGFTLIELLAVIIILAIIALIATPIVLDVINDAKKSAAESEANLVLSSINNYCATEAMKVQMGTVTAENAKCKTAETVLTDTVVKEMVNTKATVSATETAGVVTALTVTSNGYTYTLVGGRMSLSE